MNNLEAVGVIVWASIAVALIIAGSVARSRN